MIRAENTKVGQKGHLPAETTILRSGTKKTVSVRNDGSISATKKSHRNPVRNQGQKRAQKPGQNTPDQALNRSTAAQNKLTETENTPIRPITSLDGHYSGSFSTNHKTVPTAEVSPELSKTALTVVMATISLPWDRPENRPKNTQKLRHPQVNSESSNELFEPKTPCVMRTI